MLRPLCIRILKFNAILIPNYFYLTCSSHPTLCFQEAFRIFFYPLRTKIYADVLWCVFFIHCVRHSAPPVWQLRSQFWEIFSYGFFDNFLPTIFSVLSFQKAYQSDVSLVVIIFISFVFSLYSLTVGSTFQDISSTLSLNHLLKFLISVIIV